MSGSTEVGPDNSKEGPILSRKLASEYKKTDWGILSTMSFPSSTLGLFWPSVVFRENSAKLEAVVAMPPVERSTMKVSPTFCFSPNFLLSAIYLA